MILAIAPPGYSDNDCLVIYAECDGDMNKVGDYVDRLWETNENGTLGKTWTKVPTRSEKVSCLCRYLIVGKQEG